MTSILTLSGLQHAQLDIIPSAIEVRDKLANEARAIAFITDAMDADAATSVLRDIAAQIKVCEATRTEIKAPVLELTRKIDGTAKDFAAPLEVEKARLSRILGAWQQGERDKAEKAQREAQAEARRVADEEAKKVASAEIEHGADAPETVAATEAAADRVAEARVAVAQVAPVQPKGTAVKRTWKFEVTDLKALAAGRPELVIVSPNNAAINAIIKHNQSIPGLRVWEDVQTIIR